MHVIAGSFAHAVRSKERLWERQRDDAAVFSRASGAPGRLARRAQRRF